jgi:hypothetical protein
MCSVIQSKVPANVSKTSRIPAIDTIVELLARPIESQLLDSVVRLANSLIFFIHIECLFLEMKH